MKRFIFVFLLFGLVSCGDVLQNSVDEIANQTSGMLNFSSAFSEQDIAGIWENSQGHEYAEVYQVYEDSTWLELSSFERITQDDLVAVKNNAVDCNLNANNESDVDFIETRHYYEFKADTYRYFASAKVTYRNGSSTHCQFLLGAGEYSIFGSYLYLNDLESSLYVEILSLESLFMGFSE